ncbi:MAG: MFS transporter [Fusobacteriaceae bacterium]|jgi:OFA family oxalate/formate antiporter-like MFS transporter|nr:MFS transporter [Fusobacteriaceae bacterium]
MKNNRYKWFVLVLLSAVNMTTAAVYVWSIFNLPLVAATGWTLPEVSLAYSIQTLVVWIGSFISGKFQTRRTTRAFMWAGALTWSFGWILAGFTRNRLLFYFFFGVVGGLGNGILYNVVIASIGQWFADRKGMALGIVTGVGGLAQMIVSPVGNRLIETRSVFTAFTDIGAGFAVMTLVAAVFYRWPDAGEEAPGAISASDSAPMDLTKFFLLWFIFFACACSGLIMSGHASNMGQSLVGLTSAQGAMLVMLLSVVSFLGRMIMGFLSDRIRTLRLVGVTLWALLASQINLIFCRGIGQFLLSFCLICFSFGAAMCLFPKIVAEQFGNGRVGRNWSIFFSGYTLSAMIGPILTSIFVHRMGAYRYAFYFAAALLSLALVSYGLLLKREHAAAKVLPVESRGL